MWGSLELGVPACTRIHVQMGSRARYTGRQRGGEGERGECGIGGEVKIMVLLTSLCRYTAAVAGSQTLLCYMPRRTSLPLSWRTRGRTTNGYRRSDGASFYPQHVKTYT